MTPRSAKSKGVRLQNYVKDKIHETFSDFREGDVKTAVMGESGVDIILSPHAKDIFPFSIECKNVEKLNFWKAFEQAEQNAIEGTYPLLIAKKNRKKPVVLLDFDTFLKLLFSY